MYPNLTKVIEDLDVSTIPEIRKQVLQQLINFAQNKVDTNTPINLNFICTHNSRRSHFAQIWAQTMASFFKIKNVYCYSGGTETTALFPKVIDTLKQAGFDIKTTLNAENPKHEILFSKSEKPIIGFSKSYDDDFNPKDNFAAIMTCSHADENCPTVYGCDARIPITYNDPKAFDNSPMQTLKYQETSILIAREMKYVFSKIHQKP